MNTSRFYWFFSTALFLLVVFSDLTLAANWYVDKDAPGSNNGTSWTNAWKTFSAIDWSRIEGGDNIYISGGPASKTYTPDISGTIIIGADGAGENARITIATGAKSPFPLNHDGKVIIDGNGQYANFVEFNGHKFITLDGEKEREINWTLKNTWKGGGQLAPAAINSAGGNPNGAKITYMEISNAGRGIAIWYANSREITHCFIHDIFAEAGIQTIGNNGNETWGSSKIHHNVIKPMWNSDSSGYGADGIQSGSFTDIYDNVFEGIPSDSSKIYGEQHSDLIQASAPYTRIYDNSFTQSGNAAIIGDLFSEFRVYNNVFFGRLGGAVIQLHAHDDQAVIDNVKIFNNTITDMPRFAAMRMIIYNSHPGWMAGWEIKNNIIYNCGYLSLEPAIWFDDQVSPQYSCSADLLDYNNLSAGAEGNTLIRCAGISFEQPHGQSTAPIFVSYSEFSQLNDLHLSSEDNSAKDKGLPLAAYFTFDRDGTSRPQGSGWDIGAYEVIKDVTRPSPPTGLIIY